MKTRKVELVMQPESFAHGPFVMNTMEEIKEAYNDYHRGKFGFLED